MASNTLLRLLAGKPELQVMLTNTTRISDPAGGNTSRFATVVGLINGPLSFEGHNNFNNPLSSGVVSAYNNAIDTIASLGGSSWVETVRGLSMRTTAETLQYWTGSEIPSFSIEMLFVDGIHSIKTNAQNLMSYVLPVRGENVVLSAVSSALSAVGVRAPLGTVYQAPHRYLPNPSSLQGGSGLKIGNWFQAFELVVKNVSISYSKELTPRGSPLYMQARVTVQPYRMIDYKEFNNYFT